MVDKKGSVSVELQNSMSKNDETKWTNNVNNQVSTVAASSTFNERAAVDDEPTN